MWACVVAIHTQTFTIYRFSGVVMSLTTPCGRVIHGSPFMSYAVEAHAIIRVVCSIINLLLVGDDLTHCMTWT